MKQYIATVLAFLLLAGNSVSQPLPDTLVKKIDSLFIKWNANSPGCAIGIVKGDSLIYAKGYGLANLEYRIPNTPETIFHMASVSKQFTAYCIVLLAKQGRLKLDDDVRRYLPWFTGIQEKITIRNLLNHTSGIRDQWQLLAISGTRLDDVITQEHIVKLLGRQQALNFKPGEQYSYSNSGYTMAAEIVKSVTGKTLREFADSAIFKPLGMTGTHFHDDYTEIVKNRSYSYQRNEGDLFTNSILSYSNAGATSLFTNIPDMSRWIMNFYNHKAGTGDDIQELTRKGILTSGKEISYALGISVDNYKGRLQYSHAGGDAGYRTYVCVFPALKMGIMVFSNLGDFNPVARAYEIADLFIKDTTTKTTAAPVVDFDTSKAILKDAAYLQKFSGNYISEDGTQFSFVLKDQKLYWERYGRSDLLYKGEKDTFLVARSPEVRFVFSAAAAKDPKVNQYWPGNERLLTKYTEDSQKTDQQLQAYTGKYYCPEIGCTYGIILRDHQLYLTNEKYEDTRLTLAGPDHLFNDFWWMSHLKLLRSANKKITGFEVNNGRIMHLRFNKTE